MQLTLVDALVIAAYFLFNLAVALYLRRRATQSVSDFFISGRNVSWWLAGTSMVATTFAADTRWSSPVSLPATASPATGSGGAWPSAAC